MRTLIQGGWIIGCNGAEHRLLEDGVIVYEDDRIVHVGKSYSGHVDEIINAKGKIVSPGFIDTHFHAETPISNFAFTLDEPYKLTFGNPNIPFAPTRDKMGMRKVSEENFKTVATLSFCSLLKSGCTTVLEMGAGRDSLVDLVGELGLRAYLGPSFRSAEDYVSDDGTPYLKDWDQERGFKGLDRAVDFINKYDGAHHGRVRGVLNPAQVDFCTPELLRAVREKAREVKVAVSIHAGQRIYEFHEIIRRYNKTPVGYLKSVGLLGPDLIIAHSRMVSGHRWTAYSGDEDVQMLAETGTSIAHCPYVAAKTSCFLDSFKRFRDIGVNVTLGTDTWPLDIINEMRWSSLVDKIIETDTGATTALNVYSAATLCGAKALRRSDIGKLIVGAKADIIIIDLNNLRFPAIADPIKALVYAGTCDDVETVIVDGKKLVEKKRIVGVDEKALIKKVNVVAKEEWAKVPEWDWARRTIDDIGPQSLKKLK